MIKANTTNVINNSIENNPAEDVIINSQNESPAVTARDLNLEEEVSILYRIDKGH